MTPEEITALARQLAETMPPCGIKDPVLRQNCIDLNARHFKSVIELILKTHFIVPKVDVLNQHAWYMQRMKEVSSSRQMNRGKAIALENLFGKEMFETKETTEQ